MVLTASKKWGSAQLAARRKLVSFFAGWSIEMASVPVASLPSNPEQGVHHFEIPPQWYWPDVGGLT